VELRPKTPDACSHSFLLPWAAAAGWYRRICDPFRPAPNTLYFASDTVPARDTWARRFLILQRFSISADKSSIKESRTMIELTRLNGNPMVLNSDLIKTAEASPDTMLTLITGEKLIVRETCAEVMERVLEYRACLLASVARQLPPGVNLERIVSLSSLPNPEDPQSFSPGTGRKPGSR
jgi:flagellar protein FlbD